MKVPGDPPLRRCEWGGVYSSTCIITICSFVRKQAPGQLLAPAPSRFISGYSWTSPPGKGRSECVFLLEHPHSGSPPPPTPPTVLPSLTPHRGGLSRELGFCSSRGGWEMPGV